jgi:Ca2+-binding RTX toxin-like protein
MNTIEAGNDTLFGGAGFDFLYGQVKPILSSSLVLWAFKLSAILRLFDCVSCVSKPHEDSNWLVNAEAFNTAIFGIGSTVYFLS